MVSEMTAPTSLCWSSLRNDGEREVKKQKLHLNFSGFKLVRWLAKTNISSAKNHHLF